MKYLVATSLSVLLLLAGCGEAESETPTDTSDSPIKTAAAKSATVAEAEPEKAEKASKDSGHSHGKTLEDMSPEEQEKAKEEARKAIAQFTTDYNALPSNDMEIFSWDGVKGAEDAKVTVVEFADFDCPHCKLAAAYVQDLVHRYGDQVRFVFKNYPLGKECNDGLKRDVHPNACRAAVGVVCAGRQGKFWPQHDGTFENQGNLGKRTIKNIAKSNGLDMKRFEDCLEAEGAWKDVENQVLQGRSLGLTGTPAFYVNGKALPSPHPLMIEAALRAELKTAGASDLPEDKDNLFGDS